MNWGWVLNPVKAHAEMGIYEKMGIVKVKETANEPGTDAQSGLWPPDTQTFWPSIESFQLDRKMYAMYIACRSKTVSMPTMLPSALQWASNLCKKIESDGGILWF